METNALITFKGTTKVTSLSKGDLVYLDSTGNWTGIGTGGIGSYIQVNSAGSGLEWTNIAPLLNNPYASTDIRYSMWNQNLQSGSETRGHVGYVRISVTGTLGDSSSKTFIMFTRDGNPTDYGQSSTDAGDVHTTAHGVEWDDNNEIPDEHVWKIVHNSGSGDTATYDVINSAQSDDSYAYPELGNYCINPSSISWLNSTGFKVNIIQNGTQWTMKRATGTSTYIGKSLAFWNPIHVYTGQSYGYVITLLGSGTTYTTTNFDFTFIT